jgi:hypothetical protein
LTYRFLHSFDADVSQIPNPYTSCLLLDQDVCIAPDTYGWTYQLPEQAVTFTPMPLANDCSWGLCLASLQSAPGIFGFAEFVQALALLVVIYTVTSVRYRFRINVAPIPLWPLTFAACAIIGIGTLLTDVLFATGIRAPRILSNHTIWQSFFATLFLGTVLVWIWYAFIRPPTFSARNADRFLKTLYAFIVRGSDSELPEIASEVGRSAGGLVRQARVVPYMPEDNPPEPDRKPTVGDYADEVLLLIGNRKFCRFVVKESPGTAIALFSTMASQQKYRLRIGQFATNVSTEALVNKDSLLYHEDEGYYSGLVGYVKPFSTALYGNWALVEELASLGNSPLDIALEVRWAFDAVQLKAYCIAYLIALADFLDHGNWHSHSYALFRGINVIKDACRDAYKIDGQESHYRTDESRRLDTACRFAEDAMELLARHPPFPTTLRFRGERHRRSKDFYDDLAEFMFEVIFAASSITSPRDTAWGVHYGTVWHQFFGFHESKAATIIRMKLRRLLYDEIRRIENLPNYKSARILGFCLNILGVTYEPQTSRSQRDEHLFRKAIVGWTKRNYLRIVEANPDVAAACIIGSISFDAEEKQLSKSYLKGLNREEPRDTLDLDATSAT